MPTATDALRLGEPLGVGQPDNDLLDVPIRSFGQDNVERVDLTQQIITPPVITFGVIYDVRVRKATLRAAKPVPVPG